MALPIHSSIQEKLEYFQTIRKIPNILFHGPSGSGKRTLVHNFVQRIYDHHREKLKAHVMYVNCSHGKGIKFIREDLKFFAKTHIQSHGGNTFKSIVLLNADKLTMDAQSALRRCIELFSHNTRFFIVAEDKYSLMKPILSRFCEIYVPEPMVDGNIVNLCKYNVEHTFGLQDIRVQRDQALSKLLSKLSPASSLSDLMDASTKLYERGYSAVDLLSLMEKPSFLRHQLNEERRYQLLMAFNRVKREFRNEKLLCLFVLHFLFLGSEASLENISFM